MDPVSILAITNASIGITRSLVLVVKELYEIAESYETAATGIRTIASQCTSFQIAVDRIRKWLEKQSETSRHDLDEDFWHALKDNLDTSNLVIGDIQNRIKGWSKSSTKFWTRTKYLWNHSVISELQSQIQALISALSILIHVIDLPDLGAKRAQSRASSKRLNGLTVSIRRRVRESQDKAPLVHSPTNEPSGSPPPYEDPAQRFAQLQLNEKQSQQSLQRESTTPPIDNDNNDLIKNDTKPLKKIRSSESEPGQTRGFWRAFRKKSSKDDSGGSPSPSVAQIHSSEIPSSSPIHPAVQSPPAISSASTSGYFELDTPPAGQTDDIASPSHMSEVSKQDQSFPTGISLLTPQDNGEYDHYKAAKSSQQSFESSQRKRPDYSNGRTESSERFDRIRPAQRVKEAQARSEGQESVSNSAPSTTSPGVQLKNNPTEALSAITSQNTNSTTQTWKTTAITNRSLKLHVQFDKFSFTNKLSSTAAQAFGTHSDIDFTGNSVAILTLLSTVSDGFSVEPNTVIGDEVEFVVMPEHESRTPVMVLGQAFAHLTELTEAGEYIYWHAGPVPEKLRTVDRLRLYNRFELVKW